MSVSPPAMSPLSHEEDYWSCVGPSLMTVQERRHYERQAFESEGFDIDGCFPHEAGNIIRPLLYHESEPDPDLIFFTEKAVEHYNSNNQSNQISQPRIVKVNRQFTGFITYYITFTAKDAATSKRKTYQAKVDARVRIEQSVVLFCRLKPKKAQRPVYTVPDDLVDWDAKPEKEMKKKKRKRPITGTEVKQDQSTNTSGCCAAAAEPANAHPHPAPAHEAEEAVEPLNYAEMEEPGEGTAKTE